MTVENLETNGTQTPATTEEKTSSGRGKASTAKTGKDKEVVALSLKGNADKESKGLKLYQPEDRLPENRPIGRSHLQFKEDEMLPGGRPVEASHMRVVSTYSSVGGSRPVVSSGMEVSSTLAISGNRPIALSHLHISETYTVMGNRPVASNEIDDPEALMGFLD
jgi:hypothetical protein